MPKNLIRVQHVIISAHTDGTDGVQSEMHQGSDTRAKLKKEEIAVLDEADKEKKMWNLMAHYVELSKSGTMASGCSQ